MAGVISQLATQLPHPTLDPPLREAGENLRALVEPEAYVGEVVALGYSEAIVQIHDHHRQRVGGIPALCFLVGTRVNPQAAPDPREEDSSAGLAQSASSAFL